MATVVNVYKAKTHLARLSERVKNGEKIILAKAGKPCARLAPLLDELGAWGDGPARHERAVVVPPRAAQAE